MIASIDPLELKRAITARSVYAKAGAAERPVTASMFPALGVASKETSKVPFGLSIAVFCQLAELVTHGEFETVTPAFVLARVVARVERLDEDRMRTT